MIKGTGDRPPARARTTAAGMRSTAANYSKAASKRRTSKTSTREPATEQRILDAARAIFLRDGTAGARMQEIAAAAGVNQALLHYYFRTKERLSAAVFQLVASRIFPALSQTLAAEISLDEKVDRLIAIYLDNLSQNLFVPGYLISELHHHPARVQQLLSGAIGADPQALMPALLKKLEKQINERVRDGTMRPIKPQQFVINLISLCVFPFAARPMLSIVFCMDDAAFTRFIDQRKKDLPEFFRSALRP
ncbi:MAG: TetR/AcrR family transcriptional regulator [Gemmatimonadaceae bacterium]